MRNELNNITNKLFKTDLAEHKVELADVASFNKAFANAESKIDVAFKGKQSAKDGLLSFKVRSQDAMRAFDSVITEYNDLVKAAKMLGLEIPSNFAKNFEQAKVGYAKYKSEFNLADKLLSSMP